MSRIFFVLLIVIAFIAGVIITTQIVFSPKFVLRTNGSAVVKEMQKLNRLETASYTVEKVIDAGTKQNAFSEILFGDKILLIAHGQVTAGFDMAKLDKNKIKISGSTLEVTLPPPQILSTRLDNDQTRVYDRRQGILSKGDKDLESFARKSAEVAILEAACKEGILDMASENGKKQLTSLFAALGFNKTTIIIPKGNCL